MHNTTSLLTKNFLLIVAFFVCSINSIFTLDESSKIAHQTLIQNDDFSKLDKNGNPIGWSCTCQWQATKCDLKNDPTVGIVPFDLRKGDGYVTRTNPKNYGTHSS